MGSTRTTQVTPLLSTSELTVGGGAVEKLITPLRLKALLSLLLGVMVVGLSGLLVVLVSQLFARLTPSMRADLEWKAEQGAHDLAQTTDLGLAVGDEALVAQALKSYPKSPDILAIVAVDAAGSVLATQGTSPIAPAALFAAPERRVQLAAQYVAAWAGARIEGKLVGRVAVVVSTGRLEEGERLRWRLLGVAGIGCLVALALGLVFVHLYLVPLITLSHQGLRTAREMEIAKRIQTSILPRHVRLSPIEHSASMIPAADVGGDYYDIVTVDGGCWLGIGDVAGHGVRAGLIMMMLQSTVSALVRRHPDTSPTEILEVLNAVLFENIRHRLRSDEHVTLTLLRLGRDGVVRFAGAHEEILILRRRERRCLRVETEGTWLGAVKSIASATKESQLTLEPGDLMVLYTDGITEAQSASGERFGVERICKVLETYQDGSVDEIRARLLERVTAWTARQEDDMTVVVLRFWVR